MQCVRCSQPLPPRADRCLRCFALNPQNRPEPKTAAPSTPIGSIAIAPAAMPHAPLGLTFESDPPPPQGTGVGALSIESDPPPHAGLNALPELPTPSPQTLAQSGRAEFSQMSEPAAKVEEPVFTALDPPEFTFDDPSISRPPQRVIDLRNPRASSPGVPVSSRQTLWADPLADTIPEPKREPEAPPKTPSPAASQLAAPSDPSAKISPPQGRDPQLSPREIAPATSAPAKRGLPASREKIAAGDVAASRFAEPQLTPAPQIDPPPRTAPRALDRLAEAALHSSDLDLPLARKEPNSPRAKAESPDLDGLRALPPSADEPRPPLSARLTAWAFDGALIALVSLLFVGVAALELGEKNLAPLGNQSWQSWADGLLFAHQLPLFWSLLFCAIALGYSWLFAALGGRTPGLRLAGLKLLHEDGTPLNPVQALVRATLALVSAALGLFGFLLALVDPRGQTLHDKLSRSLLVVSGAPRRGSA